MKEGSTMNIRDLIPWSRTGREVQVRREGGEEPGLAFPSDIDRMFDDFWRRFGLPMPSVWGDGNGAASGLVPRVDVRETEQEVEVIAELPGMNEADVDVSLAPGMLTIRGEKKSERDEEKEGYVLRERSFGRVERVVPVPDGLDLDSAKAVFKDGVLTVTIAKTAEARQAVKRIPVQRA
jgi:HSP20 family protein